MARWVLILFAVVFVGGCKRDPKRSLPEAKGAPSGMGNKAQVRIGEDRTEENWGHLPFEILKVIPDQKQVDAPPWHIDGGDWTFIHCRTFRPFSVPFIVGVRTKPGESSLIGWGEATIVAANRNDGIKLLKSFGLGFKQKAPPERDPQPLEPGKFRTAVLGENMNREPEGGFAGKGGNWSATKWFLDRDGFSGEVFFNYNLKEMKGEFSEKDADYREDLLALLAISLRDGPRPVRTPQNDPNFTDVGPKIGKELLLTQNAESFQFGPLGKTLVFTKKLHDGSMGVFAVRPERPDQQTEVARVPNEIQSVTLLDPDATQLLVVEVILNQKELFSSEVVKHLWFVDCIKKEKKELNGPWKGEAFSLADIPVSPDGRFIVMEGWRNRTNARLGSYMVVHVHDRKTGESKTLELVNESLDPIGWAGEGQNLRLALLKNDRWDKETKPEWFLAEPATGKFSRVEKPPLPADEQSQKLSPDQNRIVSLDGKEKLTITHLKNGEKRSLLFHEDDRRLVYDGAIQWVSSRYLFLDLNPPVFLDSQTMKMSYPLDVKDKVQRLAFSPDLKWALWQKPEEGLYLGPVVLPLEGSK